MIKFIVYLKINGGNKQMDVIPTVIMLSSYGGQKTALFSATVSAADVLKFASEEVKGIKTLTMRAADDGANVTGVIGGDDNNEVTVGSGPSAETVNGTIIFRSY